MKNEKKPQHQRPEQSNKKHLAIIITVVVISVLLIVSAVVFALVYFSQKEEKPAPTQPTSAAMTQAASTEAPTAAFSTVQESQPLAETVETSKEIEIDEELSTLLSYQGIGEDYLRELSTSQIITVSSYGNTASVDFWEVKENKWTKNTALSTSGYIGETGVTDEMSEYIRATPRGFFPVGEAFYISQKPDTGLDSFKITSDTYWVDDPSSDFYNQKVEGTQYQDWSSAEHMIDYSNYEYGFVIGYNLSCVKGAGSAIFFHIGYGPTAGCIAVSQDKVLSYLSLLDKTANPYILIN